MVSQVPIPTSLRLGEIFAVLLGLGLSTITIGARVYVKSRVLKKFLSEDYFSIAAYIGLLAYLALAIVIGKNDDTVERKAYLSMIEVVVYEVVIVLTKTSILLQYVTVFVVHRKRFFHIFIHIIIWGNAIFALIVTFLFIYRCEPQKKLWLPQTPGVCHDERGRGILSGAGNVLTDFLILILPLPVLVQLQMSVKRKLRLFSVFGFGLFACIASVVRFVYSFHVINTRDSVAYQLNVNRQGLLAFAEIAIGIIVGCVPATHKLYKHLSKNALSFDHWFPHSSSSSSSGGGHYWRKLFGRSSSSNVSRSRKRFTSTSSESPAPHIDTLNMTRASFTWEESHTPIIMPMPASLPPAAVAVIPHQQQRKESVTPRLEEGGNAAPGSKFSGIGLKPMSTCDTVVVDEDTAEREKGQDLERGLRPISTSVKSWQQQQQGVDADTDVNRTHRDKNETTRAQYEFGYGSEKMK